MWLYRSSCIVIEMVEIDRYIVLGIPIIRRGEIRVFNVNGRGLTIKGVWFTV